MNAPVPEPAPESPVVPVRHALARLSSLRVLVPVFTALAALGLVLLDATAGWQERRAEVLAAGERRARAAGAALLRNAERSLATEPAWLGEEIGFIATDPEVVAVAVFDAEGHCVHAHDPTWAGRRMQELLPPATVTRAEAAQGHRVARLLREDGDPPTIVYLSGFDLPAGPGELRGHRQGVVYLRLEPLLPGLMPILLPTSFPVALGALLIALMALGYLHARVVRPLRRLAEAAATLARGGSPQLPVDPAPLEVQDLALAFGAMAGRIGAQFAELDARRKFERAVLDALHEGVLVADTAGRVLLANVAALELCGERCDPARGGHLDRLFAGGTRAALVPGADAVTCQVLRPSGASFWAEVQVWPFESVEGPVEVLVLRDVTAARRVDAELSAHRERLEELVAVRTRELAEARRLAEQASQSKSDFLATVSHEIRTPLNALVGLLELTARTRLDAEQARMLAVMQDATATLLTLIADLLDLSRIEAGRLDLAREPFSVEAEVARVAEGLDAIAGERQVDLRLWIDDGLPERVLGDAPRLRQILANLLGNAIKFSSGREEPGRVLLMARCTACTADTARLEFSVRDNGIGMRAEDQARLFAPFEQADAETSRRFGGTGLGLSIVRRLVEAMDGRIEVHSVPGLGSVFTVQVDLPIAAAELPGPPPLAGCHCVLVAAAGDAALRWRRWLARAGARVEQVQDLGPAAPEPDAGAGERTVWVVHAGAVGRSACERLLDRCDRAAPPVVLLHERTPGGVSGLAGIDVAVLDTRFLTRERLTAAVAAALLAGRTRAAEGPGPVDGQAAGLQRVLVVDDSPTNRLVIERQLAALGHRALVCESVAAALAACEQESFAVVLSDLRMPGSDGFEFARRLRAREAERGLGRVPMIALTANVLDDERQRSLEAGMDDCLTKPVTLGQLRCTLAHWLAERPPAAAAPIPPIPPIPPEDGPPAEGEVLATLTGYLGDDPAVLRDYLQVLVAELEAGPDLLARCLRDGAFSRLAVLAHQLKSSARSVGAGDLARATEGLERAAASGAREAVEAPLREVERQIRHLTFTHT